MCTLLSLFCVVLNKFIDTLDQRLEILRSKEVAGNVAKKLRKLGDVSLAPPPSDAPSWTLSIPGKSQHTCSSRNMYPHAKAITKVPSELVHVVYSASKCMHLNILFICKNPQKSQSICNSFENTVISSYQAALTYQHSCCSLFDTW